MKVKFTYSLTSLTVALEVIAHEGFKVSGFKYDLNNQAYIEIEGISRVLANSFEEHIALNS